MRVEGCFLLITPEVKVGDMDNSIYSNEKINGNIPLWSLLGWNVPLPISKATTGAAHPQRSRQLIAAQGWTVPPPRGQDAALGSAVPRSQLCSPRSGFCLQ